MEKCAQTSSFQKDFESCQFKVKLFIDLCILYEKEEYVHMNFCHPR